MLPVGQPRNPLLRLVQLFHAIFDDAKPIDHRQVLYAHIHQVQPNGDARRTSAVDNYPSAVNPAICQLQRVHQRSCNHNSRAVLIIVEHRNITDFLEPTLNFKAARRSDVL